MLQSSEQECIFHKKRVSLLVLAVFWLSTGNLGVALFCFNFVLLGHRFNVSCSVFQKSAVCPFFDIIELDLLVALKAASIYILKTQRSYWRPSTVLILSRFSCRRYFLSMFRHRRMSLLMKCWLTKAPVVILRENNSLMKMLTTRSVVDLVT